MTARAMAAVAIAAVATLGVVAYVASASSGGGGSLSALVGKAAGGARTTQLADPGYVDWLKTLHGPGDYQTGDEHDDKFESSGMTHMENTDLLPSALPGSKVVAGMDGSDFALDVTAKMASPVDRDEINKLPLKLQELAKKMEQEKEMVNNLQDYVNKHALAQPESLVVHVGQAGPRGANGARGPRGPTGDQGTKGPTGPRGLEGAKGHPGSQGGQGPVGRKGDRGLPGLPGFPGPPGPRGAIGFEGSEGPPGAKGPNGRVRFLFPPASFSPTISWQALCFSRVFLRPRRPPTWHPHPRSPKALALIWSHLSCRRGLPACRAPTAETGWRERPAWQACRAKTESRDL